MKPKSGLLWLSCPSYTVGLLVVDSVVKFAPAIARWTIGKHGSEVWKWAKERGMDIEWWPDVAEEEEKCP